MLLVTSKQNSVGDLSGSGTKDVPRIKSKLPVFSEFVLAFQIWNVGWLAVGS